MLTASHITFFTIFGGLALAIIFYAISVFVSKKFAMSMEVLLGLAANAMTLSTILCFMYNLGFIVVNKSLFAYAGEGKEQSTAMASLNMEGNEATAFFAFVYAFGMIAAAVRRNIMSACVVKPGREALDSA